MSKLNTRTFQLLSLLQRRAHWAGEALAQALETTPRTLRRDIERLRDLGYTIEGDPGVGGGYRLRVGHRLPPLMLDDDEAAAIAIGLRALTGEAVAQVEDIALGALLKLEALLPERIRARANALYDGVIWTHRAPTWQGRVDLSILIALARARRAQVQVRFHYTRQDGHAMQRHVEPHHIIALEGRWYLLGWDLERDAWRTFRIDRLQALEPTHTPAKSRALPGGDPVAYLTHSTQAAHSAHEATVVVTTDPQQLTWWLSWTSALMTPCGAGRTRLVLRQESPKALAAALTILAAELEETIEVESLDGATAAHLSALGARLNALATTPRARA